MCAFSKFDEELPSEELFLTNDVVVISSAGCIAFPMFFTKSVIITQGCYDADKKGKKRKTHFSFAFNF